MRIHKLSSTDAFIAFDLDDAPAAGLTRLARKILRDGAELLARSTTYAFASFGLELGGASAGINAQGDERDAAVEAFVAEVTALVSEGKWVTDPGLGLSESDLAPLRQVDKRPASLWSEGLGAKLDVQGAVAAANEFAPLEGARVVIDGENAFLVDTLKDNGAEIVASTHEGVRADLITTECDVLFAGGKTGSIDHELAALLHTKVVVPFAPVPVTTRGLAVLTRADTVVVPDFISTAAPLLAGHDLDGGDPTERVREAASKLSAAGTGAWMQAATDAEDFLVSWQHELPFGRPIA